MSGGISINMLLERLISQSQLYNQPEKLLNQLADNLEIKDPQQSKQDLIEQINSALFIYFEKHDLIHSKLQNSKDPLLRSYPILLEVYNDLQNCLAKFKLVPSVGLQKCEFCEKEKDKIQMLEISKNNYSCPSCTLERMNLLCQIHEILIEGFVFKTRNQFQNRDSLNHSSLSFKVNQALREQHDLFIDLRCIQLSQEGMQEITFPQNYQFFLNEEMLHTAKSLSIKESRKKRKDSQEYFSHKKLKYGMLSNHISIREIPSVIGHRIEELGYNELQIILSRTQYVFGLYLVKKLRPAELINKIKEKSNLKSSEVYKQNLVKYFNSQNGYRIESMKLPLQCQIDLEPIITPVRGKFCEHQQCFCLEHFINLISSVEHCKWRCIICKKPLLEIVVDKYQEDIIKVSKGQHMNVFISNEGQYRFMESDNDKDQILTNDFQTNGQTLNLQKKEIKEDIQHQSIEPAIKKKQCYGKTQQTAIELD